MSSAALTSSQPVQARISNPALSYNKAIGLSLVLIIVAGLLYLPIIHHPFANIDDQGYVYDNLHVRAGLTWGTVTWALTTFDDSNWHPLTWFSHAMDCQLFGLNPAGHHAMNIAFHAVDAVVLFWVLLFATGFLYRSFMVAALFAVHPMNVEVVAWAAERKTVLSMLFFLLALGAYRWYARQPTSARYATVAALFVLGLMAKPQIITFPFVLLLWDYWPLRRMFADKDAEGKPSEFAPMGFWALVNEKIPLIIISAGSALITMKAQHAGHPENWPFTAWIRIGYCFVAYMRYLGKAIWPSHLALLYVHPGYSLRMWHVPVCALLLFAITALVLAGRRYRYLPVGWFWFLGMLFPVIGVVPVAMQAMADRYAYQSFLGLFMLACWGVADWARKEHLPKSVLAAASVATLCALSLVTHRQIGFWQDNLTLWEHAAQVTDNNWPAENMVAVLLMTQGHRDEAVSHYRVAIAMNPDDLPANLALAINEQNRGNLPEAVRLYQKAISESDDPMEKSKMYQNLAVAYRDLGQTSESVDSLRQAAWLREKAQRTAPAPQ